MTVFPNRLRAVLFVILSALSCTAYARGATNDASLSGVVTSAGRPVANATVIVAGNDRVLRATTGARGGFSLAAVPFGTYSVVATANGLRDEMHVDLASGGATIALALGDLASIGHIAVARDRTLRASGADVSLNSTFLTRSPTNDSFPETLIQLPGAARGANGVVHINGDHGVIDYLIDGVALPQALNREVGSEIDPADISFLDVIEGAYPAQYGLRFGAIMNVTTRSGSGPAGFDGDAHYGSYGTLDQTLGYHTPLGNGGGYDVAIRNERTARGLDPPGFASPHDSAGDANQFARITLGDSNTSATDLTVIHSFRTFQIPNDTRLGEPAATDDGESQDDTFASLQFRRRLGRAGSLSFGPAVKVSHIRDYGDPSNDWTYGEALNLAPAPYGNGRAATDCATALSTGAYSPTTCAYSLRDGKTALDAIVQGDYVQQLRRHDLRAGIAYDATRVDKSYAVTLQPNNFLAPIRTPLAPAAPITVADTNPNVGNTYQSYVQDSWRISDLYEADCGLRYDFFTIRSTDFAQGFGAFSPRLKLTRFFGPRTSFYAYVGRFFEPFSFENVDPNAAQQLNLPLQPAVAQFDLKPERDTQLEFGGNVPAGRGELGFRIWQKNANDLIDDTQVGVTLLHQDINYTLGRLSAETVDYVTPLPKNGRAYVNVNHTVSRNRGCETQLLAPCFGSATIYTPADHEQRWSITGGLLANDRRGGWFSANAEYGSGLSSGFCMPATDDCKETPHTIFALEKGFAIAKNVALTARILNLLNDRYYVTLLNAQGTHVAQPRSFDVGLQFRK